MTTPISATTSSTTPTTSSSASSSSGTSVDYNAFLQLLVQEMKNQDPTSPSDPTQYLAQIASFSNVEQGVQTNTKLATLLTSSALTQAELAIGKTVTSSDGTKTGVVKSVALASDGTPKATLDNGSSLTLDSTVKVGST